MSIVRIGIRDWSRGFAQPWPSAEGPVLERQTAILSLEDADGRAGFGESAPWPGFGLETLASSKAALALAAKRLIGLPVEAYLDAAAEISRLAPVAAAPCARHAIDLALHDLAAQAAGVSIAVLLGGSDALAHVPVNAVIPRLDEAETVEAASRAVECGAGTIKLKVGGASLAEDVARVRAARDAVGRRIRLRVDANQAWSESIAIEALGALQPFDIEYVEQPIRAEDLDALARVRSRAGGLPIAADESLRDFDTARKLLAMGAVDVLIVKPMALGGLAVARRVAALAREHGVEVVVTSLLESPVGRMGALHLAASLGPTRYAHGVAGDDFFAATPGPGEPTRTGTASVPITPGLGVSPDIDARRTETRLAEAAS
jgi:o-succinylbenzoate synthase